MVKPGHRLGLLLEILQILFGLVPGPGLLDAPIQRREVVEKVGLFIEFRGSFKIVRLLKNQGPFVDKIFVETVIN
ncbi:MAG: hypothetical protein RQ801_12365 [Spirochaetaceae bacterium]|nr:hypothetical protein [Spirochaetaceae bacterium]MDT8299092.1 hypothetical protein [Spirochaetaceae bacterium]